MIVVRVLTHLVAAPRQYNGVGCKFEEDRNMPCSLPGNTSPGRNCHFTLPMAAID
jgi:hypothetical protein